MEHGLQVSAGAAGHSLVTLEQLQHLAQVIPRARQREDLREKLSAARQLHLGV